MRRSRLLTISATVALFAWFAFVAISFLNVRLRGRQMARDLRMENRRFYILDDSLKPPTTVDGEERLLVVGESSENYLLCSVSRNPRFDDYRGQWKVDCVFRPDLKPKYPRLPVWMPIDSFPTAEDIDRFRVASQNQPWVRWDTPHGTDPVTADNDPDARERASDRIGR